MAKWLDKYEQGGLVLKQKTKDNYGKKENANEGHSTAGPGWVGEGTTNRGFDYNGAWGGQFAMGGSIPGAVGFTYARTAGSAPSNGKYAKKTKASAQNGIVVNDKNDPRLKAYQDSLSAYTENEKSFKDYKPLTKQIAKQIGQDYKPNLVYKPKEDIDSYWVTPKPPVKKPSQKVTYKKEESKAAKETSKQREVELPSFIYSDEAKSKHWKANSMKGFLNEELPTIEPVYDWQHDESYWLNQPGAKGNIEVRYSDQGKSKLGEKYIPKDTPGQSDDTKGGWREWVKDKKPNMQNGGEMAFYQQGLDFTPKTISKNGSVIKDDMGQWAHPGEITEIGSNDITMQGVNYPVLGISDTGDTKMMQPNQDYKFDGKKVTEYPMAQNGDWLSKYDNISSGNELKKQAEETMARRYANRPIISQYTPKAGEAERLEKEKSQRREENSALLNRLADNPHVAKAQDRVVIPAIELYTLGEGALAARALAKPALEAAGKYLTEKTALKNAYKLNPYAFKADPTKYYRQAGKAAYEDAIAEGKMYAPRQKDLLQRIPDYNYLDEYNKAIAARGKIYLSKPATAPFVQKGELFYPINRKPTLKGYKGTRNADAEYLFEGTIPNEGVLPRYMDSYLPSLEQSGGIGVVRPEYNSLDNFNIYKKDWLKGYKEVPQPKSSVDNVGTELESKISKLKQQEVLAEESRKNLWADYKAGKITGEEYAISAKKLNPTPFDNPRYTLEKQLREHKVKQEIVNTPQQNILKSEEQLGKNISDGGTNNKGVFELGDNHVARLSAHGYDDASRLVNYADKIKSPRIAKTVQVKEIDGKVYQVQEKVQGTPITKLSKEDYNNIPKQHIDNFWKDKSELDKLGLSIDISGGKSNVFYDTKKGFQFIDLGIGKNESNKIISETLKLPKSNGGWLDKYK